MVSNEKLIEIIEHDIIKCVNFNKIEGSKAFFDQMIAKYSTVFEKFSENLSPDLRSSIIGKENDFRPELKATAERLRMKLLLNEQDKIRQKAENIKNNIKKEPIIFISHRSIDKTIAEMIFEFLVGMGIPRESIFCSSLPGNDINEKISSEVKIKLKHSVVNIAILSNDYYQSAYCLNEAGIMWYCDTVPVIPIALPEISPENMFGFLNSEYKIRRLNCLDDISYIYDTVRKSLNTNQYDSSFLTASALKLISNYEKYISEQREHTSPQNTLDLNISSNDEAIVLYYILTKKIRKINKENFSDWIRQEELYNVNIDNAFDLLSTLGNSKYAEDELELDINIFREYSRENEELILKLEIYVEKQRKLSRAVFDEMWKAGSFDDELKLFIAYIIDERVTAMGNRWLAEHQITEIKNWENKNFLKNTLSENYKRCLNVFIENDLVYETSWTSHGNPREYSFNSSLKKYLFSPKFKYTEELLVIKQKYN